MSARLALSSERALGHVGVAAVPPRAIGRLVANDGLMLECTGFPYPVGTGALIDTSDGSAIAGEVIGFRGERTLMMPFIANQSLANGARVVPVGDSNNVVVGDGLLGRIIDAEGNALDGGQKPLGHHLWPLNGKRTNPLKRGRVTKPLDVQVKAINALLTMGIGQRVAIVAGSGVGKSVLMGQILAGAQCDVLVVGLIGERSREVSDFIETKLPPHVRQKSVVVAVPGDQPPLLRLRAAKRATAIAESFRAEGRSVLLLIDSLTRVAHAQREIGLSLGEPPTMKGYPPSVFGIIPALIERAGNDRETGGSITAIYTVLADGGDLEDPIVDAARAIVDGHIVLSRSLAEQGVFPAVDVSRSLSRTMPDCVDPDHLAASTQFRKLWSLGEQNRDLVLMGAFVAGADPMVDLAISRQDEQRAFIAQAVNARFTMKASVDALVREYGQ
jgi:flagellum-specific ATP synthase